MEAASRGLRPEELSAADRDQLKATSRQARPRFVQAEVLPGSGRCGDPREVSSYEPAWRGTFAIWRDRLSAVLGRAATRIDHVGSTAVPGLAAKPVIEIQVSVPDVTGERSYLPSLESAGLMLRLRETGTFPVAASGQARDVHVHVCASGSSWERSHLLFRDYLRADPAVAAASAATMPPVLPVATMNRPGRSACGRRTT